MISLANFICDGYKHTSQSSLNILYCQLAHCNTSMVVWIGGDMPPQTTITTLHEKYATHIPQTNALSPSYIIYYIHGNTTINILILQIVCMLHKSHHCIIYELGGNILPPTSVKQYITITRDLAISHLASQQLLYDVSCQPNSHHITQDILLHCGDICDVYKNQYIQLGGTLYYNITHLQNSKHTYNNQPFVYHIG
jgi:hypothetical protein